uniref:Flagellar basal body rod protein FlgB n=1 Tax=Desulfobacca acetoxidans TaxID=60893 RepID=A0A7V4LCH5_9BACT
MTPRFPSDGIIQVLERSLTLRSRAQELIAANLANLDTPHYVRKEVDFQQALKQAVEGGQGMRLAISHEHHLTGSRLDMGLVRETGKPVDLDQEMVQLSKNHLGYQASITMLNKKLDELRAVIEGGKV